MEKIFFFDLETTGVKHWKNGIHQISGGIVIDGEMVEGFDFKVQPNPAAQIEDEALAIAGVDRETVCNYPPMKTVYNQIIKMLSKYVDKYKKTEKFHLAGFNNASFDNQFFRAFFVQNGDQYFGSWFWADSFDVMVLASYFLRETRHTRPNFKLMTVAAAVGLEVDEARLHDASYDIYLTHEIFKIVTE